jgi:hypothetical protein
MRRRTGYELNYSLLQNATRFAKRYSRSSANAELFCGFEKTADAKQEGAPLIVMPSSKNEASSYF